MKSAHTRAHVRRVAGIALALTLFGSLAACGGDDPKADGPEAAAFSSTPRPEPDTEPLTGAELPLGESAARDHSVLVVKIDNVEESAPQLGLSKADLVVEEEVEGGATRLAAFYYSALPKEVGPVRSMRASDIGIVSPVNASVITSGAAQVTIDRIKGAGVRFFQEGVDGIYRDTSRYAPHNVFADLKTLAKQADNPEGRPADYMPWGVESDFVGVRPATQFTADFGYVRSSDWEYAGGTYVNTNSFAADGDQFPADTVLVLRVRTGDAGYLDPAGNPVPETKLVGKGPAMIFHAGQLMRATWNKTDLAAPMSLSTPAGEVRIPSGRVWIELVPMSTGSVTFR